LELSYNFSEYTKRLRIPVKFEGIVREIEKTEGKRIGEICFIFVSRKEIIEMNRFYLKHDYVTDVITFNKTKKNLIRGDIYICPEFVNENAKKMSENRDHELMRIMIHGILHLLGYEDNTKFHKERMHEREDFYLGR